MMKFLFYLFVIVIGFVQLNAEPIKLSVYYESLCPDSIRFITTQLYPTYKTIGGYGNSYLNIDFVPYGKANTIVGENGTYSFTCQHGPRECEGNKVQACALAHYPSNVSGDFINCAMNASDPPSAGPDCSNELGIDYTPVSDCLLKDGSDLLANLGNRTHSLVPTLYYVPWIVYNDVFNDDDLWSSQEDFLAVLCTKLGANGSDLPSACEQRKH